MLNRDFFRILIKIIGLYFFIEIVFSLIPSQISFLGFDSVFSEKIGTLVYILIIALISVGILYFLIRFPDKIINLFKLDRGFENERIPLNNFNSTNILILGIIIIGGFLIIDNISLTVSLLYQEIKGSNNPLFPKDPNSTFQLAVSIINLLIGVWLLTFRKNIAAYFEK